MALTYLVQKCAAILTEEEDLLCQIQGLIARQKYLAQTRLGHDSVREICALAAPSLTLSQLLSDLLMADVDCAAPRRSLYLGKDVRPNPAIYQDSPSVRSI